MHRYLSSSVLALSLSFLPLSASQGDDERMTLPYQLGPYPVSASDHEILTDRPETLAPSSEASGPRRLMVTVYQPLAELSSCPHAVPQPYMPAGVEQLYTDMLATIGVPSPNNDLLSHVQMSFCPASSLLLDTPSAPIPDSNSEDASGALPLIVFTHGRSSSRLLSQTHTAALASAGYTVLSVDHPYDSWAVEFPDGHVARSNYLPDTVNMTEPEVAEYTALVADVRAADVTSALDALERGELGPGLAAYAARAMVRGERLRAGLLGHSLGGATAAVAVLDDERIVAGANLDGTVWGRATNTSADKPFVMVAGDWGQPEFDIILPTWEEQYPLLGGFKRWLEVKGSKHLSFFDAPIILDLLGLREGGSLDMLGTIEGVRMQEIVYRYFVDFFGMVLKGKGQGLMAGPSPEFEEVEFVRAED